MKQTYRLTMDGQYVTTYGADCGSARGQHTTIHSEGAAEWPTAGKAASARRRMMERFPGRVVRVTTQER